MQTLTDIINNFKSINLGKNIQEILSKPISILTIAGLILILLALIKIKKVRLNIRIMSQIGVMLALATVLKICRVYHFPQGGSITIGSMVPILLMSLFYGPEIGFLTGGLYGIITLIMDPFIVHPTQVLFDYPLPFLVLGIAGYFRNNKLLGCGIAIFMRYICHVISGVIFFGSYAPKGTSPLMYSLSVNTSIVGPDGIICLIIIALLPIERLYSLVNSRERQVNITK
ncbi:energy-coupled thiamine transporter ThiT [Clostridium lundense]|uniref:energy-coupled thiamine transporter ThiT n=1 Tax=Clostridium lundense TaxID=319475 RepID=UPI000686BEB3|nr:energy-coupled thiamine transporter ThiT [Clostridium lundense]